jgi:hypothetical protein
VTGRSDHRPIGNLIFLCKVLACELRLVIGACVLRPCVRTGTVGRRAIWTAAVASAGVWTTTIIARAVRSAPVTGTTFGTPAIGPGTIWAAPAARTTIGTPEIGRWAVAFTSAAAHLIVWTGTTWRSAEITAIVAVEVAVPIPSRSRPAISTQMLNLTIQPRDFVPQLVEQSDHFLGRTAAGDAARGASVAGPATPEVTRRIATGLASPSAHLRRRTAPHVIGTSASARPLARWPAKPRTIAAVTVAACVAGRISIARLMGDVVIFASRLATEIGRCRDFVLVVKRPVFVVISPERRCKPRDTQPEAHRNGQPQNVRHLKACSPLFRSTS